MELSLGREVDEIDGWMNAQVYGDECPERKENASTRPLT